MLYGVTAEEARQAAEAFLYDNPDVYYYAGQICDMRQESQGVRVRLNYHQCDDGKFSDALRKITEQLDKKITSYTTDYEVAKLVYEYLVETVEGETEPYQDPFSSTLDTTTVYKPQEVEPVREEYLDFGRTRVEETPVEQPETKPYRRHDYMDLFSPERGINA